MSSFFASPLEEPLLYEEWDGEVLVARLETRDESLVLTHRSRVVIGGNHDKPLSFLATLERHDLLDSAIAALVRGCEGDDYSWLRAEVASCLFQAADFGNMEFVDALVTTSHAALGITIKDIKKPIEALFKGDWTCAGKTLLHLAADSKGGMLELVQMLLHMHTSQCRDLVESELDGNGRSVLELAMIALGLAEKEKDDAYLLAQAQRRKKEDAETDVGTINAKEASDGQLDASLADPIIAKLNEVEKAQLAGTPKGGDSNNIELFKQVLSTRVKKEVMRLKDADKNFENASRRLPNAKAMAELIHKFVFF